MHPYTVYNDIRKIEPDRNRDLIFILFRNMKAIFQYNSTKLQG